MKILLVQPPYVLIPGKRRETPADPPMGLAYLAAYLRERMAGEVDLQILDAIAERLDEQSLVDAIASRRPDLVGFTATTLTANVVKRMARRLRPLLPEAFQVVGGVHASCMPFDMLPELDASVIGEGEQTFHEICKRLQSGDDVEGIYGTAVLRNGERRLAPSRPYVENLDVFPFPARDLLPMSKYEHEYPVKTANNRFATFFTSRGCPWNCSFCSKARVWGTKARFRSPENIVAELEELRAGWNPSHIFFYDDTFTANRQRVLDICDRLITGGFDFRWTCLSRADRLDDELVTVMRSAGCEGMQIGVESGNDETLKRMNKGENSDTIRKAFQLLHKHKMRTKAYFLLGYFGEDLDMMRRTVDFALELDPAYAFFSSFVPLPGTDDFVEAEKRGFLETKDWEAFNFHGKPIIHNEHFTGEELEKWRRWAYRRFYLRPSKILRFVKDVVVAGKLRRMWRNFRAFLDLS